MNAKVTMGLRILLGLMIVFFGVNKFAQFLAFPPIAGDGGTLMGIYATSGFMKIIGVLEIIAGLGLLFNKFVPLSLTFIVAILFNATLFHVLHDMGGVAGALVGLVLSLVVVYAYKSRFKDLLSA